MQRRPVPQDGKGIRPQPVAGRFHHRQDGRGRDGGINGVAPPGQHGKASLGRQRL